MEIENFESVKRWRNNLKGGKISRARSWEELYQRLKQVEKEDTFFRNLEIESTLYAYLTILKEKWLYVDIERGNVISPRTWSKKDSKKVLEMAEKRLQKPRPKDRTASRNPYF